MTVGFEHTLAILQASDNVAAKELLLDAALDAPEPYRTRALEAIMQGAPGDILERVVLEWDRFDPGQQELVLRHGSVDLSRAVRQAYAQSKVAPRRAARDIIRRLPDYDAVKTLLDTLEQQPEQADDAAELLEHLVRSLADDLDRTHESGPRAEVARAQTMVTEVLRQSLRAYAKHRRQVVPRGYLMVAPLATREAERIQDILVTFDHPCREPMIEALRTESDARIVRWVHRLMNTRSPVREVLRVVSDRDDQPFMERFLDLCGADPTPPVVHSLRRITHWKWLEHDSPVLAALSPTRLSYALACVIRTAVPVETKLRVVTRALECCDGAARRVAAEALEKMPGPEADDLVLRCLEDEDAEVELAATRQIRARGIADAMAHLVRRLDHADERVRQAARESLSDLTFARYLSTFDEMDESTRRRTGLLILKVDPNALATLREHCGEARYRQHRIRAARAARLLEVVDQMRTEMISLLSDDDSFLRREAIEALATTTDPMLIDQLYEFAALPRHSLYQAAKQAIGQLERIARDPGVRAAARRAADTLRQGRASGGRPRISE